MHTITEAQHYALIAGLRLLYAKVVRDGDPEPPMLTADEIEVMRMTMNVNDYQRTQQH